MTARNIIETTTHIIPCIVICPFLTLSPPADVASRYLQTDIFIKLALSEKFLFPGSLEPFFRLLFLVHQSNVVMVIFFFSFLPKTAVGFGSFKVIRLLFFLPMRFTFVSSLSE